MGLGYPVLFEGYRDSGNTQGLVKDGVTLASATTTNPLSSGADTIYVGGFGSGTYHFGGYISEVVWWAPDLG
jgi:hypothetical protein